MLRISTLEEYLATPKSDRYRYGFYIRPLALEWDEWEAFDEYILKTHPIQSRLRSFISWSRFKQESILKAPSRWYRYVFRPCHPIIRASIPRTWCDLDHLMVEINFAIIKQFKQEMDVSYVNWDSDEKHIAFRGWIEDAINWIDVVRPALQKEADDAGSRIPPRIDVRRMQNNKEFQEFCAVNHRVERSIEEGDTLILKGMIENRGFFWT